MLVQGSDERRLDTLLARLRARGLVVGERSVFGEPLLRVRRDHEPQALLDANRQQRSVVTHAYATAWPGAGLCAAWVERVVEAAGFGFYPGSARDVYERDCHLADTTDLQVGMVVAVPTVPYAGRGMALGHVALYVGDGIVRDSTEQCVRTVPLDLWLVSYGLSARPRWGWLGGLALS